MDCGDDVLIVRLVFVDVDVWFEISSGEFGGWWIGLCFYLVEEFGVCGWWGLFGKLVMC